jgi:hypothetical protein
VDQRVFRVLVDNPYFLAPIIAAFVLGLISNRGMENERGFLGVAVSRCVFGLERIFMEIVHKQIQFGRCVGKLLRIRLRRVRMPL